MRPLTSTRPSTGRTLAPIAIVLLAALASLVGTFLARPASSSAPSVEDATGAAGVDAPEVDDAVTAVDGVLPADVTVFDDEFAGIANLDPDLLHALRQAATDAAVEGIELRVNSGWRSPEYQEHLRRDAVHQYGSEAEAARWVASADTSAHVAGQAVDVGPFDATVWLEAHGADYGLCQTYDNEPWHYELRPEAVGRRCPPRYADPTDDPRMQE